MAKKTTKPTQQRAKEEQWRRRVTAQGRATSPTFPSTASNTAVEDEVDGEMEPEGYIQADMLPMPSVSTSPAATRPATAGTAARTSPTTSAAASAAQRRALAASRAARSRLVVNALSLDDEMNYVRADVRSLLILTAICLAIIIALAFLLPMIIK